MGPADDDKTIRETPRPCPKCGTAFSGPVHQGCPGSTAGPTQVISPGPAGPSRIDDLPPEAKEVENDPTRTLNQYLLVKLLGKGGMGEVWKAWDRKLTRWVAVKFLLGQSEEGVARFKREARLAARLSHPNIAPIHEVGEAPSNQPGKSVLHFISMEFIDGTSLAEAKLPLRDLVDLFIKVAQGVERAHKGGVLHRDLKPANIMLTSENWPYVMDFGLARPMQGDSSLSATGAVMGTPAFMPPEQVEGRLDDLGPPSDVYSLGATMYAVFCGTQPFAALSTMQVLRMVCGTTPVSPRTHNAAIPPDLEALILRAMAKAKSDRFPSAAALADELKKVLQRLDAGMPAPAAAPPAVAPPPAARLASLLAALVLAVLVVGGAAAAGLWFYLKSGPGPSDLGRAEPPPPAVLPKADPKPEPAPPPKPEPRSDPAPRPLPGPKPAPKPDVVLPPKKAAAERGLEGVGLDARRVEEALAKGGRFLAGRLDGDSRAVFAILHTPVYAEEAALAAKLAASLRDGSWIRSPTPVQAAAWRILAIEAAGDPLLRPVAADGAQFLVETQGRRGLWGAAARAELAVEPWGLPAIVVLGGRALDPPPARELMRKGPLSAVEGDLATTELALFALAAAERAGARAPRTLWDEAARGLGDARDRSSGGWGTGTAPGLAAFALAARNAPDAARAALDAGAWRASMDVASLPPAPSRFASLERAGAALRSPFLHDLEWYPAGAKALLDLQRPDGSWEEGSDPVAATSAALLFLARATSRAMEPPRGGESVLETRVLGAPLHVHVVLDASGWMRQDLDGRERFDVAKEVAAKVAESLPAGATFGLRVFGARRAATDPEADLDTHLIAEPGPVNAPQIRSQLEGLRVRGKSPLSAALGEAAKDLARVPPEVDMTTLLLVDGRDSDRKADPATAVAELAGSRKGMPVHVVGFNLDDDAVQERLGRMAKAGGGRFVKASAVGTLVHEVLGALKRSDAYALLGADGKEVARGVLGERRMLPAGAYTFVVGEGAAASRRQIRLAAGLPTLVLVDPSKLSR